MQSLNIIKQDGIKHNASSNVIEQDRINALIMFHTMTCFSDHLIMKMDTICEMGITLTFKFKGRYF
jgi:hypothetical protein